MTEPIDLNARRERRDDREDHEIQAGFAFEHVRKGFYDYADLQRSSASPGLRPRNTSASASSGSGSSATTVVRHDRAVPHVRLIAHLPRAARAAADQNLRQRDLW